MNRHDLVLAAAALALVASPVLADGSGRPLRLAQTVNESVPGGVEHRPSEKMLGGSSRGITAPSAPRAVTMPAPAPAPAAASGNAASGKVDSTTEPQAKPGSKPSKKATRGMPDGAPAAESPPAPRSDGVPGPLRPDESIPGGAERSPGNAQ